MPVAVFNMRDLLSCQNRRFVIDNLIGMPLITLFINLDKAHKVVGQLRYTLKVYT